MFILNKSLKKGSVVERAANVARILESQAVEIEATESNASETKIIVLKNTNEDHRKRENLNRRNVKCQKQLISRRFI